MPLPATSVSAPLLAVMVFASELPVSIMAAVPVPVRFCTLLASVTETEVFSVLLPVLTPSLITSSALLTTNVSLPVPPTSVARPIPATSTSLALLAVITLARELPVSVILPAPVPVNFCTFAAAV